MTEAEWLACKSSLVMLDFLSGKISDRKMRLFACACCRSALDRVETRNPKMLPAIEAAERFADREISAEQLWAIRRELGLDPPEGEDLQPQPAGNACTNLPRINDFFRSPEGQMCAAFILTLEDFIFRCRLGEMTVDATLIAGDQAGERIAQCHLWRDVINPFRPIHLKPASLMEDVVNLAVVIYRERAFDEMPKLAETLVRSGCTNKTLVSHCRESKLHVRGCWALDLILGKD